MSLSTLIKNSVGGGVALIGLSLIVPHNAQAALISGVTASTNMGEFAAGTLNLTVNGAGLPGNTPSLTGNHVPSTFSGSWLSAGGSPTGTITFNLNGSYNLAGFSFWNFIGDLPQSINGINGVTVQASTDGTTFTTIGGAPTQFAQVTATTPQPPEQFSFTPVQASFVRFVVNSNYDGNPVTTGFSEVQFDGTPVTQSVPEPSTLVALLTLGLAGFSLRKRL